MFTVILLIILKKERTHPKCRSTPGMEKCGLHIIETIQQWKIFNLWPPCYIGDEPQKCYAKWYNLDTRDNVYMILLICNDPNQICSIRN